MGLKKRRAVKAIFTIDESYKEDLLDKEIFEIKNILTGKKFTHKETGDREFLVEDATSDFELVVSWTGDSGRRSRTTYLAKDAARNFTSGEWITIN
tara:strand:+ start:29012 stop:29299 length:288 start_codon:yes stop_codon:yes gene_type:complete